MTFESKFEVSSRAVHAYFEDEEKEVEEKRQPKVGIIEEKREPSLGKLLGEAKLPENKRDPEEKAIIVEQKREPKVCFFYDFQKKRI